MWLMYDSFELLRLIDNIDKVRDLVEMLWEPGMTHITSL